MQNRIDATIDMARAEREALRWILLSALWHGRPYGVSEHVLLMTARDVLLRSTADQIRAELVSLEKRGLVSLGKDQPLWWAELTAEGESVVEYRSDAPACIARPPRW